MKDITILALAGITALTIIEITCLLKGIDHAILAAIVAVIAGLSGYKVKEWRESK